MEKERKLIKVLKKISTSNLNRFLKFVDSPYFNSNTRISTLLHYCIEKIKENKDVSISESDLKKKVFKSDKVKDVEIRKVFSDSLKLFEKYLGVEYYQNNQFLKLSGEFKSIQELGLDVLYTGYSNYIEKQKATTKERASDYFYAQLQNEKTLFSLKSQFEKKNKKLKDLSIFNFSETASNLDKLYLYEQTKILFSIESWNRLRNLNMNHPAKERILTMLNKEILESEPMIKIFYLLYLTYVEPDNTEHYFEARKLVSEYRYYIPKEDFETIYEIILSYSTIKLNQGFSEFAEESFQVYKEVIESQSYDSNKYLDPTYFRNIVVIALRLGKYDWVAFFIEEYKDTINPQYRHNSYYYALTTLSFYKKEFEKVIELLQMVEYEDVWYNINSKTMLLAAYYELQEFEALDNLINSFKVFISRAKSLSKDRKRNYLNYLKYLNILSNISSYSQVEVQDLESKIKETPGVVSKGWLLEKIEELK